MAPLSLILYGSALACFALAGIIGEMPGSYVAGGVGGWRGGAYAAAISEAEAKKLAPLEGWGIALLIITANSFAVHLNLTTDPIAG